MPVWVDRRRPSRSRLSALPPGPSRSTLHGTTPAAGSRARRRSQAWRFSPQGGRSLASGLRSGCVGPAIDSVRCSRLPASPGSSSSGTTPESARRSPSRSACACTPRARRSPDTPCSPTPAAASARVSSASRLRSPTPGACSSSASCPRCSSTRRLRAATSALATCSRCRTAPACGPTSTASASTAGSPGRSPSLFSRPGDSYERRAGHVRSSQPGPSTWGWSRSGLPPRSTRACSGTARWR